MNGDKTHRILDRMALAGLTKALLTSLSTMVAIAEP